MTKGEIIVAIVVAIIGLIGTSAGSIFGYIQWKQKREDEKEEKSVHKIVADEIEIAKKELRNEIAEGIKQGIAECGEIGDEAIAKMKEEVREEFLEGLRQRGEEGKQRFIKNSEQIEANSKQIGEILTIVKEQAKEQAEMNETLKSSLAALNQTVAVSAESQKNSNYDRLLIVMNSILKNQKITIAEKTNLKQLYNSWKALNGHDDKIETMYEECSKFVVIPD